MMRLSLATGDGCDDRGRCWLHSRCCRRSYVASIIDLVGEDMIRMPFWNLRRSSVWKARCSRLVKRVLLCLVLLMLGIEMLLSQLLLPVCFVCKNSSCCSSNSRCHPVTVVVTIMALDRLSMLQGWLVD